MVAAVSLCPQPAKRKKVAARAAECLFTRLRSAGAGLRRVSLVVPEVFAKDAPIVGSGSFNAMGRAGNTNG